MLKLHQLDVAATSKWFYFDVCLLVNLEVEEQNIVKYSFLGLIGHQRANHVEEFGR